MYPFERFDERAKHVLILSQEEAERYHHSYISTEHLLLGLLREEDGLAAKALSNLGFEIGKVRSTIASVLGGEERTIVQQTIPTSRVKKVIEIAFEEAKPMNNTHVGTDHLLLGLLIEGEGIAARVLHDLGADLDQVRPEIERLRADPANLEAEGTAEVDLIGADADRSGGHRVESRFITLGALTLGARSALALADEEAALARAEEVGTQHLLLGLLRQQEGGAARALAGLGVTLARLRAGAPVLSNPAPLPGLNRIDRSEELLQALSVPAPASPATAPRRGTSDLLRAILRDREGASSRSLRGLGVEVDAVLAELSRLEPDSEV